jgi:hypothetical protein
MLCVRCLAMGFHPSKARSKGQFSLARLSAPRGPLHQGVVFPRRITWAGSARNMGADAEFDAALGRHARVALDETGLLHLDRAADRIDHAAELDDAAVPGALDDAPMMHSDGGINQIAAEGPAGEPRCGPRLPRRVGCNRQFGITKNGRERQCGGGTEPPSEEVLVKLRAAGAEP